MLVLQLLVVYVIYQIASTVYQWHRLRHVPGPLLAAFSKLWVFTHTLNGTIHLKTAEELFKHGSLIRIGPKLLITNDPDVWRNMLNVRSPYRRSDWYDSMRFDPTADNILSERNDQKHGVLRTKMAFGYSGKDNPHLEEAINNSIARLVKLIETKYLSTDVEYKPVDFARKASFLTLDVISEIAFGRPFGFIENDRDLFNYVQTIESAAPVMMIVANVMPWLMKVFASPLLKNALPKDTDAYGLGKILGFSKEMVNERFESLDKSQTDMLGSFISHGLSRSEAQSETAVQIVAGSDTTATALRAIILHLISTPQALSKLLAEISEGSISDPITDSEARKLPYLQAVIKEGLRIFPPVAGLQYKDVPEEGDTINGYFIPPGTKIGYSAFGLFLDPKLWGPDANVYRPERWLEGTPEEIRRKEANLELVFGYGRWQCLGKTIAILELNKILVQLLRKFEFAIIDPQKPWKSRNAGIFVCSDMWMRITRREAAF